MNLGLRWRQGLEDAFAIDCEVRRLTAATHHDAPAGSAQIIEHILARETLAKPLGYPLADGEEADEAVGVDERFDQLRRE